MRLWSLGQAAARTQRSKDLALHSLLRTRVRRLLSHAFREESRARARRRAVNQAAIEVWDEMQTKLSVLWQVAGHLFPKRSAVAFRQTPTADLVSALLSCGHVVRVPLSACGRSERLRWIGCYKCWLVESGATLAEAFSHAMPCSFCGTPHHPDFPCARPHGAGYFPG